MTNGDKSLVLTGYITYKKAEVPFFFLLEQKHRVLSLPSLYYN